MIVTDEAALRCDFLETYHILDYRALPARQAALFACGLRDSARIMQKLSGVHTGLDTALLAAIADGIRLLIWQQTEDGHHGRNRPRSILDTLQQRDAQNAPMGFDSAAAFDAWRAEMLGGEENA